MTFGQIVSLAQANPAPGDATPAEVLMGMCVLLVMMASLAMIVGWVVRIGQIGHALPAARRGVLRVPVPLTIVVLSLSMLMLLLMLLLSDEDIPAAPIAGALGAAAVEPADGNSTEAAAAGDSMPDGDAVASPDVPEDPTLAAAPVDVAEPGGHVAKADEAPSVSEPGAVDPTALDPRAVEPIDPKEMDGGIKKSAVSKMKPEQMKSAVIQTIIMDGILLAVFGAFVFIASNLGRVRLPEAAAQSTSVVPSGGMNSFRTNSPWPDLNNESSTPQASDGSIRGQRSESSLMSPLVLRSNSPYAVMPDSQGVSDEDGELSAASDDEPFSLLTELWYATEVFLAAYLPTAILRVIVVQLTVGLSGEDPGQHPFLEMLNAGVGVPVVVMILLTAVFCAPVVEELQYRVITLGGLAQLGHPVLALWVSSFLFAFAHGFPDSLALLPLAFALGYTYLRRRSYVTVMLVHFLFNGFNMALALLAML